MTDEHSAGSRALGVSVAICCHNGQRRLPSTLSCLKNQRAPGVAWEVLIIDNASTDHGVEIAHQSWLACGPAPMRIVREPRLGLCCARQTALREARHEIVSFVDDDNHVAPDWVAIASEVMSADPELGAIGSINCAAAEIAFPYWFRSYCQYYAAADHYRSSTMPDFMLNGAGMTLRREAWRDMERHGFHSQLSDRVGRRLSSCGDIEWGLALVLAGWKFRLEPRLRLEHFLSAERLKWPYLRRLLRAVGESNVVLDGYYYAGQRGTAVKDRLRQHWWWHFVAEVVQLVRIHPPRQLARAYFTEMEGDDDATDIELRLGRLLGLVTLRSRYAAIRRDISLAPWRRREIVFGAANTNSGY